jgi:hypothetical protein
MVKIYSDQFDRLMTSIEEHIDSFNDITKAWLDLNFVGKGSEVHKFFHVLRNSFAMHLNFEHQDDERMSLNSNRLLYVSEKLEAVHLDFRANQQQFSLKMLSKTEKQSMTYSEVCNPEEYFYLSVKLPAHDELDPKFYVHLGVYLGYLKSQPKSESWKFAGECYNMRIYLEPLLASELERLSNDAANMTSENGDGDGDDGDVYSLMGRDDAMLDFFDIDQDDTIDDLAPAAVPSIATPVAIPPAAEETPIPSAAEAAPIPSAAEAAPIPSAAEAGIGSGIT